MNHIPPPIINSAKLIKFALNDEDVELTDRISLYTGTTKNGLARIGEMPNLGVGSGFRILEIPTYVCGSKPGPAYTLDQNPFFEIASRKIVVSDIFRKTFALEELYKALGDDVDIIRFVCWKIHEL